MVNVSGAVPYQGVPPVRWCAPCDGVCWLEMAGVMRKVCPGFSSKRSACCAAACAIARHCSAPSHLLPPWPRTRSAIPALNAGVCFPPAEGYRATVPKPTAANAWRALTTAVPLRETSWCGIFERGMTCPPQTARLGYTRDGSLRASVDRVLGSACPFRVAAAVWCAMHRRVMLWQMWHLLPAWRVMCPDRTSLPVSQPVLPRHHQRAPCRCVHVVATAWAPNLLPSRKQAPEHGRWPQRRLLQHRCRRDHPHHHYHQHRQVPGTAHSPRRTPPACSQTRFPQPRRHGTCGAGLTRAVREPARRTASQSAQTPHHAIAGAHLRSCR